MRIGRRLAFDVGAARTGVAICDPEGIFASPIAVIGEPAEAIALLEEFEPIELYVGLPLNLLGEFTASTNAAVDFARELQQLTAVPVRMIDERLTTKSAAHLLRSAGKDARRAKKHIDAASAALILEQALSFERAGTERGKGILDFQ